MMPAKKATKRRIKKAPSPAQLKARAKFAAMAKARAKAAKGKSAKRPGHVSAAIIRRGETVRKQKRRQKKNADTMKARARNKTIITKPRKVVVLNGRKKAAKKPARRHNLDHRDAAHPIHVSQYWQGRKGYLTQWQRAHKAGQKDLFDHGIKARNPKKKAASPAVKKIRRDFTGLGANKTAIMHVPNGTPKNLAKLGRLVSIKTKAGVLNPAPSQTLWLCSDAKGKLHIASAKKPAAKNPAHRQAFGEVREIEYETAKPHLGYKKSTIFFHKMGEEGGRKPTLSSDGQYLKLRGGSYKITPRGIVN